MMSPPGVVPLAILSALLLGEAPVDVRKGPTRDVVDQGQPGPAPDLGWASGFRDRRIPGRPLDFERARRRP